MVEVEVVRSTMRTIDLIHLQHTSILVSRLHLHLAEAVLHHKVASSITFLLRLQDIMGGHPQVRMVITMVLHRSQATVGRMVHHRYQWAATIMVRTMGTVKAITATRILPVVMGATMEVADECTLFFNCRAYVGKG